jgi:hypothetical protein
VPLLLTKLTWLQRNGVWASSNVLDKSSCLRLLPRNQILLSCHGVRDLAKVHLRTLHGCLSSFRDFNALAMFDCGTSPGSSIGSSCLPLLLRTRIKSTGSWSMGARREIFAQELRILASLPLKLLCPQRNGVWSFFENIGLVSLCLRLLLRTRTSWTSLWSVGLCESSEYMLHVSLCSLPNFTCDSTWNVGLIKRQVQGAPHVSGGSWGHKLTYLGSTDYGM